MNQRLWTEVDGYLAHHLIGADPILDEVIASSERAGMPQIHVSSLQARLLRLVIQLHGGRRALEIGTLAGYSGICIARALPEEGELTTLELEADYASLAAANFDAAGVKGKIKQLIGPAAESMRTLISRRAAPFDFIFIDADKASMPMYLELSLKLSHPGTVIVGDNVVREGRVCDENTDDPNVQGVRAFIETIGRHPRLSATAIQTVGSKGYDGFCLAIVN